MDNVTDIRCQPLVKTQMTWAYPWHSELCMEGVSVQKEDTPEVGGWIGINPFNTKDRWYISKQWFDDNYMQVAVDGYPKKFL